jgi:hypothetical protein
MTHDDIRKALLDGHDGPKEIRTNDGRRFQIGGIERWALGGGRLVILEGPKLLLQILSIRNISSIGQPRSKSRSA